MKRLLFLLLLQLGFVLSGVAQPAPDAEAPKKQFLADARTEANIAKSVAGVLDRYHYSRIKLGDEVSGKFFDRYFELLDGQRFHFLQSDIEEFRDYRTTLDDMILRIGDMSPAQDIFARMMQRLDQRINYVTELLQTEKFQFDTQESYVLNRKDMPRPRDLAEAKELWRRHLRFEYLQEKLSKHRAKEKETGKEDSKPGESKGETKKKEAKSFHGKNTIVERKAADSAPEDSVWHDEIVKTLTNRYARLHRSWKDLGRDEVLELFLTSLANVYDPHSDYMGRAQAENFAISMKLSLFGIGAVLTSEDDYCKIQSLVPGPAMRSKQVKPGDRIVAVEQKDKEPVDCVGMKLNKVVEMIRGPKGSEVQLTILPVDAADPSTRKVVTLIRDEIKLEDQEAKAKVIEFPGKESQPLRVGVIDLPSFYEDMKNRGPGHKSTTADISRLLKKLNEEKISGLILDLRRNGGGALNEAIKLTGLFIKRGPVVQTKDTTGRIVVESDTDPSVLYDGPMIVLTSRFSASASEILAGALQDYGRALVVGDASTHGKGTVQQLIELQPIMDDNKLAYAYNPGQMKFTIRKFYRAGGASTQLKGVIPDLILPSVNNHAEVGEASLDNALPWDEVSSAKFEKLNQVAPYLPELKKRSDGRIEKDKDFAYIRQDIERYKKNIAEKSVSLNEKVRLKEMEENKAIMDARKKERQARPEPDYKVYEVTLKNADKPGLILAGTKVEGEEPDRLTIEEDEEDKAPQVDPTLDEAKRILADYILLWAKDNSAVTLVK